MQDFEKILKHLIKNEVEFILIGGFAASVYGVTLLTYDIDICISFTKENTEKLLRAFEDYNPIIRGRDISLRDKADILSELKNLYLITDLGPIDILGSVAGLGHFNDILPYTINLELFNMKCKVLDIDALIKSKKAMKRPKDKETILQLKAIKEKLKSKK